MAALNKYTKNKKTDKIWWKDTSECDGEWVFSFDKKKEFNLFRDYPHNLTEAEIRIFNKENPYWVDFFKDRINA